MSIDASLRLKSSLARHRNVLTRAERIARLKELEIWRDDQKVLGLPKVSNRKAKAGKKAAKEEAATAEAAAAAPAAGAAAPAAGGKAAAAAPASKPKK